MRKTGRRGFLKALGVAPLAGVAAKALAQSPPAQASARRPDDPLVMWSASVSASRGDDDDMWAGMTEEHGVDDDDA